MRSSHSKLALRIFCAKISVADPDPGFTFRIKDPRSRVGKIPDPGLARSQIQGWQDPRSRVGKIPDPWSGSASKISRIRIRHYSLRYLLRSGSADPDPHQNFFSIFNFNWTLLDPDPSLLVQIRIWIYIRIRIKEFFSIFSSASWIRIRHYLFRSGSGSTSGFWSFHQQAKKVQKNLDFY